MVLPITLKLRSATVDDADLLLAWRNDPVTQQASFQTHQVDRQEHMAWLTQVLDDPTRQLFIAEEQGTAVGMARADWREQAYELSWSVAPQARGRGLGKHLVATLAARLPEPLRAEVKVENVASRRIAEHVGMTLHRQMDGVLYFVRDPLNDGAAGPDHR